MIPDVPVTDQLLHALPKTDLHCHLDGSLRLQTMLDLADQQGVRLPADTVEGLARAMKIGQRHGSLEEYLKGFEITLSVLQTEAALYRTAYELAIDAAAENVRLLEVRYSPVLHLQKGQADGGGRGGAGGPAQGRARDRHDGRRPGVRHPQHEPEDLAPPGRAVGRLQEQGRPRVRPGGRGAWQPGQGPPGSLPADPEQQRELHGARRRGLRAPVDRPGPSLLRG